MFDGVLKTPVRGSHRRYSVKNGVLKNLANFSGKSLFWGLCVTKLRSDLRPYYKQTPTQVFFCDARNTYFEENLRTTASGLCMCNLHLV